MTIPRRIVSTTAKTHRYGIGAILNFIRRASAVVVGPSHHLSAIKCNGWRQRRCRWNSVSGKLCRRSDGRVFPVARHAHGLVHDCRNETAVLLNTRHIFLHVKRHAIGEQNLYEPSDEEKTKPHRDQQFKQGQAGLAAATDTPAEIVVPMFFSQGWMSMANVFVEKPVPSYSCHWTCMLYIEPLVHGSPSVPSLSVQEIVPAPEGSS